LPIWIYEVSPLAAALIMLAFMETVSLVGLLLARRFVVPRLNYVEGINEAVSGTVQAIGVFYGITVGLIAVGVWTTNSASSDLVSREAAAIAALYRDVGGYPSPIREELRAKLRDYTVFVINEAWPEQRKGRLVSHGTTIMDDFETTLYTFEPKSQSQIALHSETVRAYNSLIEYRRLRIDAVNSHLSGIMWAVIWVGAAISIGVAYFYKIPDARVHAILVSLMGGFLAMVLLMIIVNDRPFYGYVSISPEPYQLILDRLIDASK
jgi:hypothetical protein